MRPFGSRTGYCTPLIWMLDYPFPVDAECRFSPYAEVSRRLAIIVIEQQHKLQRLLAWGSKLLKKSFVCMLHIEHSVLSTCRERYTGTSSMDTIPYRTVLIKLVKVQLDPRIRVRFVLVEEVIRPILDI